MAQSLRGALGWRPVLAVSLSGATAMALEVAWMRLAAVLLGPSVHAFAWVLAVFLGGVAAGAALAGHPRAPKRLSWGLGALAVAALLGTLAYSVAPLVLALAYDLVGPGLMGPVQAGLAVLTMGAAPVASGLVFAQALAQTRGPTGASTGVLYGANTLAGVLGAAAAGLWLVPGLGVQGAVTLVAVSCAVGASVVASGAWLSRGRWAVAAALIALVQPRWDGQLYAVGVYSRVSDLADHSPAAVLEFASAGWELMSYEDGRTGAVAVGRSTRTGNVWLSINGKVDASTGDDMPTQVLSGQLPVRMVNDPSRSLVVGLASGVTAGAVLAEPGVQSLVVAELEPAVVRASAAFEHVNGRPLADPRTQLVTGDARALLSRPGPDFNVIISEPSNPWITGVSNLFTLEYWLLGRARLAPDGVFCQWLQLYGLAPDQLRSLVRTFTEVFPNTWLFEPLEGADLLLLGGEGLRHDRLPLEPTLTPAQVRRLGAGAPLNTDDRPGVELAAPRAMHMATVQANRELLRWAAQGPR